MADKIPAPLRDKSSDGIRSGTLRLTLGTQAAAAIGALVTGLDPLLGTSFSQGQKTAIIIAAIALIAVAQVADVIARAWISAAASARGAPLEKAQHVQVAVDAQAGPDYPGRAVEVRLMGDDLQYLIVPDKANGHKPDWISQHNMTAIP